jgi:hypothetical protein
VSSEGPSWVECGQHGRSVCAVVCQHLHSAGLRRVGFIENSSDPNDLQAWCDACEESFAREGGLTQKFRHFCGITLICRACYTQLRAVQSEPGRGGRCAECGQAHDELSRYFMWKLPATAKGKILAGEQDHKSMLRAGTRRFVRCEIELPLRGGKVELIGLICWVEVSRKVYDELLHFRCNEATLPDYPDLLRGRLANELTAISDSWGTAVKFAVIKGDSTPYIRWAAPGTSLATRLREGASVAFWHEVAAAFVD